jgi:hypothetical protein
MSDANELAALQKAILDLHGARAEHAESVPVVETFEGETVWNGVVEVFALPEHPAGKAYAWRHEADSGRWRYVAVLHGPRVDSPRKAVQAAVVAEYRARKGVT